MRKDNTGIPKQEKKGRWRFIAASAIAVVLVCAASAGIVLAYQMRLQRQTGQLDAQVDRGPRVLVEPIHPSESEREYDIPISGWKAAGLKMPCFARVNKPVTIQKSDVKTAGKLSDSDLANVKQSLRKFWTSQSM